MKTPVPLLELCVVAAVAFACPHESRAQEAGILERLGGNVYWRKDAHSAVVRLHPRRDIGRLLYAGERVRCGQGGRLRFRVYGRGVRIKGPSGWFPIPHQPTGREDLRRKALEEYGSTGGRDRGGSRFYSPAPASKVRPSTFEIRWVPRLAPADASTLVLREESRWGRELWRQEIKGTASGRLVSDTARQALAGYRAGQKHGPLLLILSDSANREVNSVKFYLLSAREERSLRRELAFWGREPEGLWRRLGRASTFIRHSMYAEAADEYEAALAHAPESVHVLKRAIQAHRETGNTEREEALTRRLPEGESPPS